MTLKLNDVQSHYKIYSDDLKIFDWYSGKRKDEKQNNYRPQSNAYTKIFLLGRNKTKSDVEK